MTDRTSKQRLDLSNVLFSSATSKSLRVFGPLFSQSERLGTCKRDKKGPWHALKMNHVQNTQFEKMRRTEAGSLRRYFTDCRRL